MTFTLARVLNSDGSAVPVSKSSVPEFTPLAYRNLNLGGLNGEKVCPGLLLAKKILSKLVNFCLKFS